MFARKVLYTFCGVALLVVLATSSTGAFVNANRTTYFTFSKAVQLPGVVLPAGTYVFEIVNPNTSSDVVKVQSRDRSKLYLMQITLKVERPRSGNMKTALVLGEGPAGNPPAVKSWFPQDETIGRQFIY